MPGSFGSTPFKWNAAGGYQHIPFTGLYHVGAREYDPRTARWLQRDPIGQSSGDPNPYRYCGNDAVNLNDPSGLEPPDDLDWDLVEAEAARRKRVADTCNGVLTVAGEAANLGTQMHPVGALVYAGYGKDDRGRTLSSSQRLELGASAVAGVVAGAAASLALKAVVVVPKAIRFAVKPWMRKCWHKSTFGSVDDAIKYHWMEHGRDLGKPVDDYIRDSQAFFKANPKLRQRITLRDGSVGFRIRVPAQPGGIWTLDGKTITFWYDSK